MRSAFSRRGVRGLVVFTLLGLAGCGGDSPGNPDNPGALPFEHFDAGFFALDKPRGWNLVTAGSCTEFAFLVQDPAEPRRQIFYFGSVGPVYLNAQQKAIDSAYVAAGGFDIPWRDAPVVDPLTPQNYLEHWPGIAAMRAVDVDGEVHGHDVADVEAKGPERGQAPQRPVALEALTSELDPHVLDVGHELVGHVPTPDGQHEIGGEVVEAVGATRPQTIHQLDEPLGDLAVGEPHGRRLPAQFLADTRLGVHQAGVEQPTLATDRVELGLGHADATRDGTEGADEVDRDVDLERGLQLERVRRRLALEVVVRDHDRLPRARDKIVDDRHERRQLIGRVEVVVLGIASRALREPRSAVASVEAHVTDGARRPRVNWPRYGVYSAAPSAASPSRAGVRT